MDDFLWRALIGGGGVALIAGPLGCFVVWRRMAYFGAALSHAALLGVALGLVLRINLQLGILLVSLAMAWLLAVLSRPRALSVDSILGILAHGALALGLVLLSVIPQVRLDLMAYLFGDILAVSSTDLAWIYGGVLVVLPLLARIWQPLLLLTVARELAVVDGVREARVRGVFFILLSVVVAVAMQVVGILLIVSLLIIPAASARNFARSPESMALLAVVFGIAAVGGGLGLSVALDTPAGPSMVVVAGGLFAACAALGGLRGR